MPYCQYCGTKLEDGQACTCEMSQAAASQEPQPQPQQPAAQAAPAPRAESQASILFKKVKRHLSDYFSDPAQATRSVMEEEYSVALPVALGVIRLLVMGLAIYGLLRKICQDALSIITMSVLRYSSTAGILTASLTASLPQCLIFGAMIAAVGMLLFMVMVFALVKIQHGIATFADVFKASAANGVPTTMLLLLAFLASFISTTFCLIFFALAMLSWIISGVITAQLLCPNNSSGSFWLLYFVGVVLILVVGYYVIPPMFGWAVGGITASYMGESITLQSAFDQISKELKDVLSQEDASSIGELFENRFKELLESFVSGIWDTMY